jgi:Domain of unknown function (DUF4440)
MMLLMTVLVFIVIFCIAFRTPAQESERSILADEDKILALENEVWESMLGPKIDTTHIQQAWAPGCLVVTASGDTVPAEQYITSLRGCKVASFVMNNPQVRLLSANSGVIVYRLTLVGKHRDFEAGLVQLDVSTTWVRRAEKWMVQLHTETPAASPRAFVCRTLGETVQA